MRTPRRKPHSIVPECVVIALVGAAILMALSLAGLEPILLDSPPRLVRSVSPS